MEEKLKELFADYTDVGLHQEYNFNYAYTNDFFILKDRVELRSCKKIKKEDLVKILEVMSWLENLE